MTRKRLVLIFIALAGILITCFCIYSSQYIRAKILLIGFKKVSKNDLLDREIIPQKIDNKLENNDDVIYIEDLEIHNGFLSTDDQGAKNETSALRIHIYKKNNKKISLVFGNAPDEFLDFLNDKKINFIKEENLTSDYEVYKSIAKTKSGDLKLFDSRDNQYFTITKLGIKNGDLSACSDILLYETSYINVYYQILEENYYNDKFDRALIWDKESKFHVICLLRKFSEEERAAFLKSIKFRD